MRWDLYEIGCECELLHGVKLRGRIRKFAIENNLTILTENASDKENTVRFAVPAGEDTSQVIQFVKGHIQNATVSPSLKNVQNPVLSKLKVNDTSRYEI